VVEASRELRNTWTTSKVKTNSCVNKLTSQKKKDLGFDAIWISPIVENSEGGYHGYWTTNFYTINPKFGSEQDFRDLVAAAHARDIWVMIDIVANHVADVHENFQMIEPFNKPEHYHENCAIHNNDWKHNQWRVEVKYWSK
jgi:alpha-amylase